MPIEHFTYWFSQLTHQSTSFFALLDHNHRYLWANHHYVKLTGLSQESLIGKHDRELFHDSFYRKMKYHYFQATHQRPSTGQITLNLGQEPIELLVQVSLIALSKHPSIILFQASELSNEHLTSCADKAAVKASIFKKQWQYSYTEYQKDRRHHSNVQAYQERIQNRRTCKERDIVQKTRISPLPFKTHLSNNNDALNKKTFKLMGLTSNGTKKMHPFHLKKIACCNPVTELYHQHEFLQQLNRLIIKHQQLIVFYLNINQFKNINDEFGGFIGDQILLEIAQRLRSHLPTNAVIGHLEEDKYAIVICNDISRHHIEILSNMIEKIINQPFDSFQLDKYLSCAIGYALYPKHGKNGKSLLQKAEQRMYQVKAQKQNQLLAHREQINQETRQRLWIEIELQKAIIHQSLEVWYQPKVSTLDMRICGAEALLRWNHPTEGYISPAQFIPVAEQSGLIEHIGQLVMLDVFQTVHRWQQMNILSGRIAVNLSPQQFQDPELISHIKTLQHLSQIDASHITFELTENAVMNDSAHSIKMLNAIRELGFTLSVDDFGTGYSSLAYLGKFPLDEIKIDRAFITDIEHYPKQITLLKNIIHLGQTLSMTVVAEGVETGHQANILTDLKCDAIQGFYFYKPMSGSEFEALLLNQQQIACI